MTLRRRRVFWGLATTALLALILPPISAEDSPSTPPVGTPPAAKAAPDPSRRVPPHFAKVGLSTDQREAIYKARARHLEAIDAARKQLERERAAMMSECEAVLTPDQKAALEEHRHRRAGAKTASAKVADPKPATN